uniref:Granule associated Rac and RHOG effector 1 n=1 Tax=Cyprinus carpio TaxID=7962 RepID=A0A8C1XSD9_CYPCA
MYCCSAQESKMDYKLRFLLGGSKHKVQQHQQFQLPELSRTLSAPLGSSCSTPSPMATIGSSPSGCHAPPPGTTTAIADIQQGISKYLDALNAFCRASAFLTELFGSVFRDSRYSKAAMQLKDVQEHVMETTSRLTTAIKPEIGKMLMELSAGAANFKDQNDFSRQDVEVLGRCFLTVMQVHFQFLSQALQKVQPVAQSCLAEALAQVQERHGNAHTQNTSPRPLTELEEAVRSWKGASEVTACLRERGRDGCLSGIQVQQLFCSQNTSIPEHQLKELNAKIDNALQAYKVALDSLGHSEYALKAGFHLNPKSVEAALQGCCSDAEAQQAGRFHTTSQPIQCELPTIPVQIGSHLLRGVSFNECASDNLKLKTHAVLQLIKDAVDQNGVAVRDDSPVTEVLNQVCPSSWRGACKTAVQLLFGQAGLVVVDTAQIENKEAYAPQICLEGSKVVIQVPSTWCLKEDPATMSLLQRSLDPEKTLGLVDVLYTAVFDLQRWKERKEQTLPTIQIQLQRDTTDYGGPVDLPPGNSTKSSGGLIYTYLHIYWCVCVCVCRSLLCVSAVLDSLNRTKRHTSLSLSLSVSPSVGSDPEFARYVAGVNQAMQQKRQAQHVRRPSNTRSNWPHPDEQHRGWTHPEYYSEGDAVNSGWSANQGDSASSSDETSSANGDSLFSMFSGPDLVAAVKQRRKHSCGEQEVCTLPSPPLHQASDDSNQDSKTKTWPPKAPWQHSSHTNTMPNPSSSLYQMTIPSSQWGDSMQMLQSPVWSTANDCPPSSGISSGFPFTQQQQQQQQQVSQHKILSKGFKTFPLKPEHRPSYLHQY